MRKKLINQKRDVMKTWSREALVDHIRAYPNQEILDHDTEGNPRSHPIAMMAKNIQEHDYVMSDAQYYTLLDGYTKVVVPDMKVVGVSFRNPDVSKFDMTLVGQRRNGQVKTYDVDYILDPEPDNEYDPNAVRVSINDNQGIPQHVGYLSRDFVGAHPIVGSMMVAGTLEDHSNGKFKNVSYNIALDTESLNAGRVEQLSLNFDDLSDLSDDTTIEKG